MSDKERGKTQSISESVEAFLKRYRLKDDFNLNEIKLLWNEQMGQTISKRTEKMYFKDQKLFVEITSASLKHQLHMQRTKIKDDLNTLIGTKLITDIIFL